MPYRLYLGDPATSFESEYVISFPHQHRLVLHREDRNPADVEAVNRGDAELALAVEGVFIILLCRFDTMDWFAVGVPWFPGAQALTAPGAGSGRISLVVQLVQDGLVRALRLIPLSDSFAAAFQQALAEVCEATWPGLQEYLRQVHEVLARRGATKRMLERPRASMTGGCHGNGPALDSVLLDAPEDLD